MPSVVLIAIILEAQANLAPWTTARPYIRSRKSQEESGVRTFLQNKQFSIGAMNDHSAEFKDSHN
jgi:hypothetical protein